MKMIHQYMSKTCSKIVPDCINKNNSFVIV